MTTHDTQLDRHDRFAIAPPGLCLHEIAAWLDDIDPVLRALHGGAGSISDGCVRWLVEQLPLFRSSVDWIEGFADDCEDVDQSAIEGQWIHIRLDAAASMILELLRRGHTERAEGPAEVASAA